MTLCLHTDPAPFYVEENGAARVNGTRFPLEGILISWNGGESPESIVANFAPLDLEKVYSVLGYYLRHKEDLDAYLEEGERVGEELMRKIDERQGPPRYSPELKRRLAERNAQPSR